MHIDQLRIELRPRTNGQALDLGFALLRAHAAPVYGAYLALWLPLMVLVIGLSAWLPTLSWVWMMAAWWVKPALERAPLYVLSRQVFGESVTWQQALRAWPSQLGGGLVSLLTWQRPFAAARALFQPVWQLEMARGKVARARLRVLGQDGTSQSAFWFGVVCSHLEVVLQLGILGLVALFLSEQTLDLRAVLALLAGDDPLLAGAMAAAYGVAVATIAPMYTACGFTLYLNRRARLEAWDIELQLRQIRPPAAPARKSAARTLAMAVGALLIALAAPPPAALAGAPAACVPPPEAVVTRGPDHTAGQAAIRRRLDALYASEDLRSYECVESWHLKKSPTPKRDRDASALDLALLAQAMKVLLIAALLGGVGWLLYRYRHLFPALGFHAAPRAATEVGGLDIRAASLPDDVTASVRTLWANGEARAALGLLYRATLSRMVTDNALPLRQGATEGDCLRLAGEAQRSGTLSAGRYEVAAAATALWRAGAWGNRWPDTASVHARCAEFDTHFAHRAGATPC